MSRPVPPVTETDAYLLFERLRWGGAPLTCPHCAVAGRCYFLNPRAGRRATRTGRPTERRVWKCGSCRRQFSVLVGTIFEGTRIELRTWFAVLGDWMARGECPPVATIRRDHDLSPESARFLLRRLGGGLQAIEPG